MITDEIKKELFLQQDEKYRDFQSRLIPTLQEGTMVGVRTPILQKLAKQLIKREDVEEFLNVLPHQYFEENQLHVFIISQITDFNRCMEEVCRFLPFVDNWATCDQMRPKIVKAHRPELLEQIKIWMASGKTYTVRFAIEMLMEHFLEEDFLLACPKMVAEIRTDEYYINMMIAWYFATALAKQYDAVLPFIEEKRLAVWTHNKVIQKAVESSRITPEQKVYLRSLKIRKKG